MSTPAWAEHAARAFEPAVIRWPTPGAMARDLEPGTLQTSPLDLIDAAVAGVVTGDVRKQQIYAPPQVGKSQRVSRWTPLWALTTNPKLRIVIVSAEKELAVRWGRQIKRDLEQHPQVNLKLREDSKAAGRWETVEGGELFCTGISSGTTGRPIDLLIIDDPIKNRADAESKTIRDRVWDFWENDGGLRARRTILMNTRWHTDDLSGRLLQREAGMWRVLSMPAIADDPGDALGRQVGEEIQSANRELHPAGYYTAKSKTVSSYVWSSLYQQSPTAAEGGLFKRGDWRYWTAAAGPTATGRYLTLEQTLVALDECYRFITIDLATSTKTSADYTVASAWAIAPSGDMVLLDRTRTRVAEAGHFDVVQPLRQRWLGPYDVTYVESRMFGTTMVYAAGRSGIPLAELVADVDKFTRALPAADLVRQNRIWLPANAPWLDEWLDEHADFPSAKHDDQVDTTAYAARVAHTRWLPQESADAEWARMAAAGPNDELDLMSVQY